MIVLDYILKDKENREMHYLIFNMIFLSLFLSGENNITLVLNSLRILPILNVILRKEFLIWYNIIIIYSNFFSIIFLILLTVKFIPTFVKTIKIIRISKSFLESPQERDCINLSNEINLLLDYNISEKQSNKFVSYAAPLSVLIVIDLYTKFLAVSILNKCYFGNILIWLLLFIFIFIRTYDFKKNVSLPLILIDLESWVLIKPEKK